MGVCSATSHPVTGCFCPNLVMWLMFFLKRTAHVCPVCCLSFIWIYLLITFFSLLSVLTSFTFLHSLWILFLFTIRGNKGCQAPLFSLVVSRSKLCTFCSLCALRCSFPQSQAIGNFSSNSVWNLRMGQSASMGCTYPSVCSVWLSFGAAKDRLSWGWLSPACLRCQSWSVCWGGGWQTAS